MPRVTVVLPTCDRPFLLPRAVESVLLQTEADFELLLVDNNRRAPPVEHHPAFSRWRRDPRVRLIRPEVMRNAALARNHGLAMARGDWISYLDDDDAWRPAKLERQMALVARSGAELVLCGATFHLSGRRRKVQCDVPVFRGDDLLLRTRWNTPLLFHRRRENLQFDENLSPGEDAELAHRLLARTGSTEVQNVPEALVDIYPQEGLRVNSNAAPVRLSASRILALRRNFYSRRARRCYVLRTLLAIAKLRGDSRSCLSLAARLCRESRGGEWRAGANAVVSTFGVFPSRWIS